MDVQVEHWLATLSALVNDGAVAMLCQTFLLSDLCHDNHQVTQKSGMPVFSLADSRKSITVLGNDQEVLWGNGCNISESQALLILKYNISWDNLAYNLVENGIFLGLTLLVIFGGYIKN